MLKWFLHTVLPRVSALQICVLAAGLGVIYLILKIEGTSGQGMSPPWEVFLVLATFFVACLVCVLTQRSPHTGHRDIGEIWVPSRSKVSIREIRVLLGHVHSAMAFVGELDKKNTRTRAYWATYGSRLWMQFTFGHLLAVVHQFETAENEDRCLLARWLRDHPKHFAVDYYPDQLLRVVEEMRRDPSTDDSVRDELAPLAALLTRLADDRRETDLRHVHCRGPILGNPEVVVAAPETQLPPMPCLARVLNAGPPDAGGDHHESDTPDSPIA